MGMFDALKKGLGKFARQVEEEVETEFEVVQAPKAPPTKPDAARPAPARAAPAKAAPPAARPSEPPRGAAPPKKTEFQVVEGRPKSSPPEPKPHVDVVEHTPAAKRRAEEEFDRELGEAVATPPGVEPEHELQGAEFEEGDRTKVPVPTERALPPPPRPSPPRAPPPGVPTRPQDVLGTAPVVAPGKGRGIDPRRVQDFLFDLEISLLEADVALQTAEAIREELERTLPELRVERPEDAPPAIEKALREAILSVLSVERVDFDEFVMSRSKPVVVMFVGVNGTGKTTAIGRIAHRLKENGFTCCMAAGDTFRAGAIEQLERHGQNLGVTVIKTQSGGDPAAVAYDAIEHAKARKKDVVLLDTAGRMQTNTNLMDEMKKIKRVAKPAMIVFVGDSLAGNDAVEQAIQFDKAVGIDSVVLTKVDTDAKGGAALSIAHAVGKPVLFLGVGQDYGDLIPYEPEWMVSRIFD